MSSASQRSPISAELTRESRAMLERMANFDAMPQLRKDLRLATASMAPELKQAARSIPSKRAYSSKGLRARIARAISRRLSVGRRSVSIYVTVANKPNTPAKGVEFGNLRHPLFGDREHWYEESARPWFWPTVLKFQQRIDAKVMETFRRFSEQL